MITFDYALGAGQLQDELLKALASSSTYGTDASPLIKEDLEMEAHTQLWLETDPTELVLLKHLPRIPAFSVIHQYDQIIGYGPGGTNLFYGEGTLPPEAAIQSRRKTETIRLPGLISSAYALASFQTPLMALGQSNLVDQNMASTRLALLRGMNVQCYASDTSTSADGIRFRGLRQQILEGTSVSTSAPYTVNPDYIIDLRGGKLLAPEIRNRSRQIVEHFGSIRWIYMAPQVKQFLEQDIDPAERLYLTRGVADPVIAGQNVDGMMTMGSTVRFAVDNTLTASQYLGSPPTVALSGAPAPLPGGNLGAPAAASSGSSLWTNLDADAAVSYVVTALNASGESTGTTIGPVTVAAGQSVTFTLTPRAADTSYKVYRLGTAPANPTVAMFIQEIIGPLNTTQFTVTDNNARIPGTTEAYGLSIASQNSEVMRDAVSVPSVAQYLSMTNPPRPRNTISLATLGPWMGIFDLAHILHTASRDLIFTAYTPVITHPFQSVAWVNVGSRDL
jgi:hypothetical protein